MRPWSIFFSLISAVIAVTMLAPHAFGLQEIGQWGGMYIDRWCSVTLTAEAGESEQLYAGTTSRGVYSPPSHTVESCIAWAHSWCGKLAPTGFIVTGSLPVVRGEMLLNGANACLLSPDPSFSWFTR